MEPLLNFIRCLLGLELGIYYLTNNIEKVDGARKRSLASQMQRLLTQIVTLPEYKWVFYCQYLINQ